MTTHPDAGLHAMRHTFLTEAAEYTDPFTLQYVAGHDSIKTTMRNVHPREAAVHKLFERLAELQRPEDGIACNKSVQNPVQFGMPSQDELAKLLITSNFKSAEVVELADAPSARITLDILYKLLILKLLPFSLITCGNVARESQ